MVKITILSTSRINRVNSEEEKQIMQLVNSAICASEIKNSQELRRKNGEETERLNT